MASSSSFNCFVACADTSSFNLQNDYPSSSPSPLLQNPQSLPMPAPTGSLCAPFASHHDQLSTSRSSKSMVVCSFAIAATTAIGLSFCSLDCLAVAAELEVNNTAIVSVASARGSPNLKPGSGQNANFTSSFSTGFNTGPDLSFSMAIPIPNEEVWGHVQNGFIAPLPHIHEHGLLNMPFSQPRKTNIVSEGSALKCPPWTPSELEMVLPDFHGRPKPFPHRGHWLAAYVTEGTNGEAFLQLFDLSDEVELDESDGKMTIAMEDNVNKQQKDDKLPLLNVLDTKNFTCFSM